MAPFLLPRQLQRALLKPVKLHSPLSVCINIKTQPQYSIIRSDQIKLNKYSFFHNSHFIIIKKTKLCMTKPATVEKTAADAAAESRFKGVRKRKWGKFVSEIRLPNSRERIWLGSYDSAEKAARAFDAALFCLRGRSARFNFPDNPPDIPGAGLLSRSEIQSAAAKFANSEPRPSSTAGSSEIRPEIMDCSSPSLSPSNFSIDGEWVDERSSFYDLHTTIGSGNFGSEFGLYPEYNSFFNELYDNTTTPSFDYGDENFTNQDSFLWNF